MGEGEDTGIACSPLLPPAFSLILTGSLGIFLKSKAVFNGAQIVGTAVPYAQKLSLVFGATTHGFSSSGPAICSHWSNVLPAADHHGCRPCLIWKGLSELRPSYCLADGQLLLTDRLVVGSLWLRASVAPAVVKVPSLPSMAFSYSISQFFRPETRSDSLT